MTSPLSRCGRPAAGPLCGLIALLLIVAGSDRALGAGDTDGSDPIGACCFFDFGINCVEVEEPACIGQGGIFLGLYTTCLSGGCTISACCISDPSEMDPEPGTGGLQNGCLIAHRAVCEDVLGGVFLDGVLGCDNKTCEGIELTGACCICGESLSPVCFAGLTEAQCIAANGVYLGDSVLCTEGETVFTYTSSPDLDIPDDDEIGISDTINIPFGFPVQDIRIFLSVDHTWIGDLCITLEHAGQSVALVQRHGAGTGACHEGSPLGCNLNNYINIELDDLAAGGPLDDTCMDNLTSPPAYTPAEPLSAFIGLPAAGAWTLHVRDRAGIDTGTLVSWTIELEAPLGGSCADTDPCAPPIDPCTLPGRPDPNDPDSGDRVLRGFIVGYAVDMNGAEIRWNHLSAGATTVDYRHASAMEFPAATFPAPTGANGAPLPNPGVLHLDGIKYAAAPALLLLNFAADGSTVFSSPSSWLTAYSELTLMPLDISFIDGALPSRTKAEFNVWNENEVKFSGAYRCITCWDSTLLSHYGAPNHMRVDSLLTDRGKARIEGVASPLCPDSAAHALLGVQARALHNGNEAASNTGSILTSMGLRTATITATITAPPPESPQTAPGGAVLQRAAAAGTFASSPRRGAPDNALVQPMAGALIPRMGTDKGSLFVIPRIEIRWDDEGNLIRDTFVHLTNDFPEDVRVQMWFVNGDPDGLDQFGCPHAGWNFVDVLINLTNDQPVWWSAVTGQPTGVSPFTVLDY